ncbi:MAG: glycosyl transferase family 1 [Deltaproteobacteria bacterium SG8_13]|nr:MAG: glycosyl transferase family 1 [Deltaproteobacteria bacterium SG8_13]
MKLPAPLRYPPDKVFDRPLRICLLSYRSNPHSGGQGVYVKNLGRALADLGHRVEVITGPPGLQAENGIRVHRLASLDLYNPDDLFRLPSMGELRQPLNLLEWMGVSTMGFPEPFVFGIRAYLQLRQNTHRYDIVHDNQSLSYGVWAIGKMLPVVATIHHPITVDRRLAVRNAASVWKKLKQLRWYSFLHMQKCVSRTLSKIITVSKSAREDISREFAIPRQRFRIVPNGIDTRCFHPLPGVKRAKNRIMVTNSADMPLKGLAYLLRAVAELSKTRPVQLVVVGQPKRNGDVESLVRQLGIDRRVTFTGRITADELVVQYARAAVAVVPSVYEGFGLPAGEAMACAVPVISTTGGALPEVVGEAGLLVPPADPTSLGRAIDEVLAHPDRAASMGKTGYDRVRRLFTWQRAAQMTLETYRESIVDHARIRTART